MSWTEPARAEAEVQRVYQQGLEQFQSRNYRGALSTFQRAYQLEPVPRILRDIGMCQVELDRVADAVNSFRRYFDEESPSRIQPEIRARIEELMRRLRPRYGDVLLQVTLPGAAILVDGHEVGFWPVTTVVAVPPGRHLIVARRDRYHDARERIVVRGGGTVDVSLDPQPIDPSLVEPPPPDPAESADEDEGITEPLHESPLPIREPSERDEPWPPPSPDPRGPGWWFWSSLGLCVAATAGAVVTGSFVLSTRADYRDSGSQDLSQWELMADLALATDVLIGVALGAGLAWGVSWLVHALRNRDHQSTEE